MHSRLLTGRLCGAQGLSGAQLPTTPDSEDIHDGTALLPTSPPRELNLLFGLRLQHSLGHRSHSPSSVQEGREAPNGGRGATRVRRRGRGWKGHDRPPAALHA